jgi:peroxiredoxin
LQYLNNLPDNLPIPVDDGACHHLLNQKLPTITLSATYNQLINLSEVAGWTVIFCYPMTGRLDKPLPKNWDAIPGARGCTPQVCSFRDNFTFFTKKNISVFGLSTQDSSYHLEVFTRLDLPYQLLSDSEYKFTDSLKLPTFECDTLRLNKRVTLICNAGIIKHVFYPVFPPDKNVDEVISWLNSHA